MVVGVVVGDDHAVDLGDANAEGVETGGEGVPGGGVVPAGVDEDGAAVGVEQVDEGVTEGVVRDGHLDGPDAPAVVDHLRHEAPHHLFGGTAIAHYN